MQTIGYSRWTTDAYISSKSNFFLRLSRPMGAILDWWWPLTSANCDSQTHPMTTMTENEIHDVIISTVSLGWPHVVINAMQVITMDTTVRTISVTACTFIEDAYSGYKNGRISRLWRHNCCDVIEMGSCKSAVLWAWSTVATGDGPRSQMFDGGHVYRLDPQMLVTSLLCVRGDHVYCVLLTVARIC